MRTRLVLAVLATLGLGVVSGLALAAAGGGSPASASALAVLVRLPDGTTVSAASVSAPPTAHATLAGSASPVDAAVATVASGSSEVGTRPGAAPSAQATVQLQGVSLFGGEVTLGSVGISATAAASGSSASGEFPAASVDGLTVLGQPLPAGPNQQLSLGFGHAVVLEQAVQRDGPSYRGFVTALHVYLEQDHAGLPAGSEILVGYAEAAAHGSKQPSGEPQTSGGGDDGGGQTSSSAGGGRSAAPAHTPTELEPSPPGATGGPPPIVRNPPANVQPQITGAGYVFPVYGAASFANDFAAPRADTIWHHGNDIFASMGTPVLAVTDGTLSLVGWNTLGGHRLWLTDYQGNEYYYAHLSAYSPLAVNGASVHAGDVIGFVGKSGASGGVPHLHFEIHPRGLLGLGYDGVVNPYEYLGAWYAHRDQALELGTTPAPAPAAVPLGGEDISTASGLDPEEVERTLGLPTRGEGSVLLLEALRPLVGHPPGF